uniref:Uncharacterized protein n=1 Tax=Rhizophora mucronata TaxID=61149 RepID=A0A2P2NZ82_RHIMU
MHMNIGKAIKKIERKILKMRH